MSAAQHHIIYVPGLGDSRTRGQELALRLWRLQGVQAELFVMHWADGEPFAAKMERLLARIDTLQADGRYVSLVGASAGGSAIINAYARRCDSIHAVIGICGKLQTQGTLSVHPDYYQRNPAFLQSMQSLADSDRRLTMEHRRRILSLHPLFDESVPIIETKLAGAQQRTMLIAGHFLGIAYGLTIGSVGSIRFIKRLAPRN